jgi:hypothetical protein
MIGFCVGDEDEDDVDDAEMVGIDASFITEMKHS